MLFNKNELKGKGFDRQKVKSKVPKELKKVNQSEKPLITLSFWESVGLWFRDTTDYLIGKVASSLIPSWFFIGLLVVAIVIVLVVAL